MRKINSRQFMLSFVLSSVLVSAAQAESKPASQSRRTSKLPIVKTWQELMQQQPVDIGNGIKVRLGVEAKTCFRYGGVLVYCLCDGLKGDTIRWDNDGVLGPLRMTVRAAKEPKRADSRMNALVGFPPGKRILFVRSLVAHKTGPYEIRISHPNRRLVAKDTITARVGGQAWMPFDRQSVYQVA